LTWAFEFEDQPYFAGFRALASNGLDLPVLNTFRMFAKMSGQRLAVRSSAGLPGAAIQATNVRAALTCRRRPVSTTQARCSYLALPRRRRAGAGRRRRSEPDGPAAAVTRAKLTQYRIDAEHSNSYTAWLRLGSPAQPTSAQYAKLEKSGQLALLGTPKTFGWTTAAP